MHLACLFQFSGVVYVGFCLIVCLFCCCCCFLAWQLSNRNIGHNLKGSLRAMSSSTAFLLFNVDSHLYFLSVYFILFYWLLFPPHITRGDILWISERRGIYHYCTQPCHINLPRFRYHTPEVLLLCTAYEKQVLNVCIRKRVYSVFDILCSWLSVIAF